MSMSSVKIFKLFKGHCCNNIIGYLVLIEDKVGFIQRISGLPTLPIWYLKCGGVCLLCPLKISNSKLKVGGF